MPFEISCRPARSAWGSGSDRAPRTICCALLASTVAVTVVKPARLPFTRPFASTVRDAAVLHRPGYLPIAHHAAGRIAQRGLASSFVRRARPKQAQARFARLGSAPSSSVPVQSRESSLRAESRPSSRPPAEATPPAEVALTVLPAPAAALSPPLLSLLHPAKPNATPALISSRMTVLENRLLSDASTGRSATCVTGGDAHHFFSLVVLIRTFPARLHGNIHSRRWSMRSGLKGGIDRSAFKFVHMLKVRHAVSCRCRCPKRRRCSRTLRCWEQFRAARAGLRKEWCDDCIGPVVAPQKRRKQMSGSARTPRIAPTTVAEPVSS